MTLTSVFLTLTSVYLTLTSVLLWNTSVVSGPHSCTCSEQHQPPWKRQRKQKPAKVQGLDNIKDFFKLWICVLLKHLPLLKPLNHLVSEYGGLFQRRVCRTDWGGVSADPAVMEEDTGVLSWCFKPDSDFIFLQDQTVRPLTFRWL